MPAGEPVAVLDASALLAHLKLEPGGIPWTARSTRSRVQHGVEPAPIRARLRALNIGLLDFTEEDALRSAGLYPRTRAFGLSLGDRASLSLATRLELAVLAADRVWKKLDVGVEVRLLR